MVFLIVAYRFRNRNINSWLNVSNWHHICQARAFTEAVSASFIPTAYSVTIYDWMVKVKVTLEEATKAQRGGEQSYQHHKHQGLDLLIRSVSRVTAARANASSVFQLFFFLVVCSGMISKGFGFVLGASKPRSSAKGAHPYRKRACLEALRLATTPRNSESPEGAEL